MNSNSPLFDASSISKLSMGCSFSASQGVTEDECPCRVSTAVAPCLAWVLFPLASLCSLWVRRSWLILCEHFLFSLNRQLGSLTDSSTTQLHGLRGCPCDSSPVPVHTIGTPLWVPWKVCCTMILRDFVDRFLFPRKVDLKDFPSSGHTEPQWSWDLPGPTDPVGMEPTPDSASQCSHHSAYSSCLLR